MVPGHILAANPAECFSVSTDPAPRSLLKKSGVNPTGGNPTDHYFYPGLHPVPAKILPDFPVEVFFSAGH